MQKINKKELNKIFDYLENQLLDKDLMFPDFIKVKKLAKKDMLSVYEVGLIEDMLLFVCNDIEEFDLFKLDEKAYDEINAFIIRYIDKLDGLECVVLS